MITMENIYKELDTVTTTVYLCLPLHWNNIADHCPSMHLRNLLFPSIEYPILQSYATSAPLTNSIWLSYSGLSTAFSTGVGRSQDKPKA